MTDRTARQRRAVDASVVAVSLLTLGAAVSVVAQVDRSRSGAVSADELSSATGEPGEAVAAARAPGRDPAPTGTGAPTGKAPRPVTIPVGGKTAGTTAPPLPGLVPAAPAARRRVVVRRSRAS